MSTEPSSTYTDNAVLLSKVLGTTWKYKSDRRLYESEPMPTEITFRINQWLEPSEY
ncbi:MAG: hypothetical protein ACOYJ2_08290 [Rickettsiales bacterium]